MVSASIIFLVGSYVIPQAILLFVDRDELLPERPFSLGRFGYAVNFISTIWTVLLVIACCLPTEYPITPYNMNYNRSVTISAQEEPKAVDRSWWSLIADDLQHCGIGVVLLNLVRVGFFEKGCLPWAKHRQSYARVNKTKVFACVYSRCAHTAA